MRIQICWITTKTLWIHYLVDVNHFFKFGKSHKVTNNSSGGYRIFERGWRVSSSVGAIKPRIEAP